MILRINNWARLGIISFTILSTFTCLDFISGSEEGKNCLQIKTTELFAKKNSNKICIKFRNLMVYYFILLLIQIHEEQFHKHIIKLNIKLF